MPLFSIDTSSRGPCVRYRMDLSINYLQFLHRIVYVVAQRFLRAWRSPRHLLVNNGLNSNDPLTRFGILALENSASECCIGLFLVFLSRSFIISIRMLDCSILALSDHGYIHWSNRSDSFIFFESENKNPFLECVLSHQNNLYSSQLKSELMVKYKTEIWKCLWLGFWQKIINKHISWLDPFETIDLR